MFFKRKSKINKLVSSAVLSVASIACLIGCSEISASNNSVILNNTDYQSDDSSTVDDSVSYNHTNYFSYPSSLPSNFNGYDLFAQTNNSMFTQTSLGILGISLDKTTLYFTSYSGKIIWAQQFSSNALIQTFYQRHNLSTAYSNLKVEEWAYLQSNGWLSCLLSDGTNQIVVTIDLATGLFAPGYTSGNIYYSNVDDNLYLNGDSVFVLLDGNDYTNIYAMGDSVLITKNNAVDSDSAVVIDYDTSALTATKCDVTFSGFSNNQTIASFIYAGASGQCLALVIDNTYYKNTNGSYYYKEYLVPVTYAISDATVTFTAITGNTIQLTNDYITSSGTLSLANFENIVFTNTSGSTTTVMLLDGSSSNNYLEVLAYDTSSNSLVITKTLDLTGNTISSFTYNASKNKIFVSDTLSTSNVFLGYIDLSASTLKFSTIQQSTDSSAKNYFLVPVLEYTGAEYLLLQNNAKNSLIYMLYNNSTYTNTTSSMNSKYWNTKSSGGNDIWEGLGLSYLPSDVTYSTIANKYLNFSSFGSYKSVATLNRKPNDTNGTIILAIKVTYATSYLSSYSSSFTITFYISGLYKSGDYVFNWIDTSSTIDTTKASKIANLEATEYACQITPADILDYFISYSILSSSGTQYVIDESMINLSYSTDYSSLTVTITLDKSTLPSGLSSSQTVMTKTYTGFLSVADYAVTTKSTSDITSYAKDYYPSQLTSAMIIANFFDFGSQASQAESDWSITISNVDDYHGTVTISASYLGYTNTPDYQNLPSDYASRFSNIIDNLTITGMVSLEDSVTAAYSSGITMTDISSYYLPSEIWDQYSEYVSGDGQISADDVLLLQNFSSSFTDINNFNITLLNPETCDADGYLDLDFTIKDGSTTDVAYTGNQYQSSNGMLVFDSDLGKNLSDYPYEIKWHIDTSEKYFYLEDTTGNEIQADGNTYNIDLKENTSLGDISSSSLATSVTKQEIASLIKSQGYNYSIEINANESQGYAVVTIDLSLTEPPLTTNHDASLDSNYVRTIYLYNFKVPMNQWAIMGIIIGVSLVFALIILVLVKYSVWQTKKFKYKKNAVSLSEIEKERKRLEHFYKKNRYFKHQKKVKNK